MGRTWYVDHNGKTAGPFNSKQLKSLASNGRIKRETKIRLGVYDDWVHAGTIKGLFSSKAHEARKQKPIQGPPIAPQRPHTETKTTPNAVDGNQLLLLTKRTLGFMARGSFTVARVILVGCWSLLLGSRKRRPKLPKSGDFNVNVVGESNYQQALKAICGGHTEDGHQLKVWATLVHDDENEYDSEAIRVDIGKRTVGYLSRGDARRFRKDLRRFGEPGKTVNCAAKIVGGWDRGGGDVGYFGVVLDFTLE